MEDNNEEPRPVPHIVTAEEMLLKGLRMLYSEGRVKRAKGKTNEERFCDSYGVHTHTACDTYEMLQTSSNSDARIENAGPLELQFFLIALYFLRNYPTRGQLEQKFDYSKGYVAAKCWEWVRRIAALRDEVITLE